jgi:hypothetical protein
MTDHGFDSPESAAMRGFPPRYCCVIASRVNGVDAYVLLNTGSSDHPYLYGANCFRDAQGRWFEGGSANGPGWHLTGDDPAVGTLSLWDDAPAGAQMVRAEFEGEIVAEHVVGGAYLFVWWHVPFPRMWPRVTAFQIADRWIHAAGDSNF